jgi:hypothetical protein
MEGRRPGIPRSYRRCGLIKRDIASVGGFIFRECVPSGMSALPPKADMCGAAKDVSYGPKADIDELRGPLGERFGLRQELSRIPSIAGLVPSLVGLPTLPCVSRDILVAHADR